MSVRVRIRSGCTGMGACVRIAPQVFKLDTKTGKAEVLLDDASAYRDGVLRAKDSCPFVAVEIDGAADEEHCDEVPVTSIRPLTSDVIELRVHRPGFTYQPGQYAFIRLQDGAGEFNRPYSVVDNHHGDVAFCIKVIPQGRGGQVLRTLKPGDVVGIGPAVGLFSLKTINKPKLFITGGTGAAPVPPMCWAAHSAQKTIIFGVRSEADLFWLDEMRAIPNTTVIPVLEAPSAEWKGDVGRVTDVMRRLNLEHFSEFYTCGGPGMVKAVGAQLRERGISNDSIFSDSFDPAPSLDSVKHAIVQAQPAEPFDWQGLIRRLHFYASLSLAGLILFYAATGFIANRANLFTSEDTAKVKNPAAVVPDGVALTAEGLSSYLAGLLPPGAKQTAFSDESAKDLRVTFAVPALTGEPDEIIATIRRNDRRLNVDTWQALPAGVATTTDALTTFITTHVSGDPDLKNREDEDNQFRLDCESVWGTHSVVVDRLTHRWQVTTTKQNPVVSLVDLHRGKHAGGFQKLLVDLTAVLLAFVTLSGVAMGIAAAARRRRLAAIVMVGGSLLLLVAFLLAR